MTAEKSGQKLNPDLKLRVISGVILGPLVIAIIYYGGIFYNALLFLAAIILSFEWKNMIAAEPSPENRRSLEFFGIAYILLPMLSLFWLRNLSNDYGVDGLILIFWLIAVVWTTDIAGYFVGRFVGGKKLAPSISPKKTWSGFTGALAGSFFAAVIFGISAKVEHWFVFALLSIAVSFVSQIGDLFESAIKRRFGVKDSGSVIPGHGGLFDRVDGLLFAAVFISLILIITSGSGIFK